nr:oxygenase MpaB family protein [Kineococcus siccus]
MWAVAGERAVLLGGPAAVLLQVAHPLVAAGVAQHSAYQAGPAHRLLGTLQAVLTIAFGDTEQGRAAARDVGRQHARVRGTTPDGTPYRAGDPELALWVHATLVEMALAAVGRYGGRPVPAGLREAYWQQMKPFGRMFGVTAAVLPASYPEFRDYYDDAVARLQVTDAARAVAHDVLGLRTSPPLPAVGAVARAVTADLLPRSVAEQYDLVATPRRRAGAAVVRTATRRVRPLLPDRVARWPHAAVALRRCGATG